MRSRALEIVSGFCRSPCFGVQTADLSIQTVYTLHNSVAGVIEFMYAHCGYLQ